MAEPIPPLPPAALIDQDGVIACLTLCGLTTDAQRHQIDLCSMQMDRFVCVLCKLIGLNLFVYFTNVRCCPNQLFFTDNISFSGTFAVLFVV